MKKWSFGLACITRYGLADEDAEREKRERAAILVAFKPHNVWFVSELQKINLETGLADNAETVFGLEDQLFEKVMATLEELSEAGNAFASQRLAETHAAKKTPRDRNQAAFYYGRAARQLGCPDKFKYRILINRLLAALEHHEQLENGSASR